MTAPEFRNFIGRMGWTQKHAAEVLGVRQSRISEWSTGARKVPPYIAAHAVTWNRLELELERKPRKPTA